MRNTDTIALLEQLWLTSSQAQIFLYLYSYGPKPASSVARNIGGERTNTYKLIETMMRHGRLAETIIKWTKQFFIPDKNVLRNQIEYNKRQLIQKELLLPELEQDLAQLDQERISPLPAMRFYQWTSDIKQLTQDIIQTIIDQWLKMIRIFSTNTLESQIGNNHLGNYADTLLKFIKDNQIATEIHLGNGVMLLEQMLVSYDSNLISSLPASQSSLTICIIWDITYILLFKHQAAGIKIESPELSEVLKFFLKSSTRT